MYQCDICSDNDNIHHSKVTIALHNFQSSYSSTDTFWFQPFERNFETDHFLTWTTNSISVQLHECSFSCTLPVVRCQHLYCFMYKSMLEYAYYHNLSSTGKLLFQKCHIQHNELYHDMLKILKKMLVNVYSIFHIWQSTMKHFQFGNCIWFMTHLFQLHLILTLIFKLILV